MATDPELSDAGRSRAQSLAATLKDAGDHGDLRHRVQANAADRRAACEASRDCRRRSSARRTAPGSVEKVKAATGPVLIVGHSNTIPEIMGKLGVETPPKLADGDYDNLFIITGRRRRRSSGCTSADALPPSSMR